MKQSTLESLFFLVLCLVTGVIATAMVWPYLKTILIALVLAFLFSGLFRRLRASLKNPGLAALVTTIVASLVILLPLSLAGYRIATESAHVYSQLRSHASVNEMTMILNSVQTYVQTFIPNFTIDPTFISAKLQQIVQWVVGNTGAFLGGATNFFMQFVLFLLLFYYLVKDGEALKRKLIALSPLADAHEEQILGRIGQGIHTAIRGQLTLGFLQGVVAGIGFSIFGVPNPALWACFVVLASFVPTVGTSLVQIPAIIYLAATGNSAQAVGLFFWAGLAVGMLDNVLGPKLMARGSHIHPMIMMLAVLGGIGLFGPIGVLLGPIVASLMFALIDIYRVVIR